MKFKGTFSDRGLRALEKSMKYRYKYTFVGFDWDTAFAGLLPTLEKFGKTCQLLLGPDNLHFIQASQDTDGMQITASWAVVRVYFVDSSSRNMPDHRISFVGCVVWARNLQNH